MSNNIRLQYSGYIIFSAQMIGVATGLIFTLLLTRNMSSGQYGIWTNIFDYTAYFTLFSGLLPFWATRFVARGKEGAIKSSTIAQLTMSLVAMAIYFPVIYLIYTLFIGPKIQSSAYLPIFLIAGLYILPVYMISIFENILQPIKPQALGYGFLIEELVKVGIASVLILVFKQLFLGAVLALVISCFVQIGYYLSLLRDKLFKQKTNWSYLREWLKGSTVIAYNTVGGQLLNFVLIILFFYGGPTSRAYYQAAFSFTSVIGYSLTLATALYPRLLSKSCTSEQIGTSFLQVMMLAIPFTAIASVMSISFLTILNVTYSAAWPVLVVLSIYTLIDLTASFYSNCVLGVESFDAEGKISLRQLVRSKIFKVFSIPYLQAAVTLIIAYFALTNLHAFGAVQATIYAVSAMIIGQIISFVWIYFLMHRFVKISMSWTRLFKYVLASVLMAVILFLLPTTTTLLFTIGKAVIGLGIYIGFLLAIDKYSRLLARQVLTEIEGSLNRLGTKKKEKASKDLKQDKPI